MMALTSMNTRQNFDTEIFCALNLFKKGFESYACNNYYYEVRDG